MADKTPQPTSEKIRHLEEKAIIPIVGENGRKTKVDEILTPAEVDAMLAKHGDIIEADELEERLALLKEEKLEQPDIEQPPTAKRKMGFKVGIVEGARNIDAEARDAADERLTASEQELRGVSGFFKKIWKYNWAKEYYRQKEISKAREEILASGNIYAAETTDKNAQNRAMGAIIERFTSEYDTEALETGEEKRKLEKTEADIKIESAIKDLVKEYASGKINEANFDERRNRLIRWLSDGTEEPDPLRKELADTKNKTRRTAEQTKHDFSYADNIRQIAEEVKLAVEHGESLEDLDINLEITLGKARAGVKTESQFGTVDRLVEKLGRWPVTRLVNETTLAGAVATAYSAGVVFSERVARSKALAIGTFGATALLGGGLAAARERVQLEKERRSHFRSLAKGKTFDPDKSPRRKELDEFVYEMESAKKLADDLEYNLEQKNFQAVLAQIAEIEARQQMSDRHKIDLISFSDPTKVEEERTRLMILKARAKAEFKKLPQAEKTIEAGGQFNYDIPDLADHKQIEGLLKGTLSSETDPIKKQAALTTWLEQRRLNRIGGYKLPAEINGSIKPGTKEAEEAYRKWDEDQAAGILKAWNEASPTRHAITIGSGDFDLQLANLVSIRGSELSEGDTGIEQKNRLFAKMKNGRAFKAGMRGVITGLVIGSTAQEVGSFFKGDQQGLIEGLTQQNQDLESGTTSHFTPLEFIRRYINGEISPAHHGPLHEIPISGTNTTLKLPEGLSLETNPGGHSYSLYRGEELIDQNIMLKPDGTIPLETEGILADHGVVIHTNSFNTLRTETENIRLNPTADTAKPPDYSILKPEEAPTISETTQVKPEDYIKNHPDIKQVHREFWYDNDTKAFDKNELKLGWGGVHGTGIDKEGNFVYSIRGMGANDSFHDKFKINPLEAAKEGKLKLLLSLSKDTQANPIAVPIGPDGNVLIDPKSDIAKMFFETDAKGQLHFIGKFAEVAEVTGEENGVEQVRILSTDVGRGLETVTDTVVKNITPEGVATLAPTPETITKTIIDTHREIIFDSPGDYEVDPPPFIPLLGRQPLEKLNKTVVTPVPYYLYNSPLTKERAQFYKDRLSPTLKENPDAELNHYQESERYLESFKPDYKKQIAELKEQIPPMDQTSRAVVCIPAAGHQEGKNIYRSLENYTRQTIDPSKFEIVVLVNHPDVDQQGNPIAPDETLTEITRFQKEHPEIKVRAMYTVIPKEKATIGHVRKLLNDAVLARHHDRGADAPDLIMISNDADNYGVSPTYLENFLTKFESNPGTDAMLGQLDWDPESYLKNPLIHVGTRLFQYFYIQLREHGHHIESSGGNFAFRSSVYAGIGGYDPNKNIGEDVDFGQMIKEVRKNSSRKNIIPIAFAGSSTSRLYTSSRRAANAIKNGLAPIEQWNRGFSAFDDEVRKFEFSTKENGIDFSNQEEVRKFISNLETVINRTISTLQNWGARSKQKEINRALAWLGLKYEQTEDGTIKITDSSKLLAGLEQYQKIGLLMRDAKTGVPGATEALKQIISNPT